MSKIEFNPKESLIILDVKLEYKYTRIATMALDTGASSIVLVPKLAYRIGFSKEELIPSSYMTTATKTERVAVVKLNSVSIADEYVSNLEARVFDLPQDLKIDGLLGLNFLRHFNININFEDGILTFNRVSHSI